MRGTNYVQYLEFRSNNIVAYHPPYTKRDVKVMIGSASIKLETAIPNQSFPSSPSAFLPLHRSTAMPQQSYCISPSKRILIAALFSVTSMPAMAQEWGSYFKPFAADSLWNSRPVNPTFGDEVIPPTNVLPKVTNKDYSTGIFLASPNDPPMTITGPAGSKGLYNADPENYQDVTIPHWPSSVQPGPGTDGHADVLDPTTGILHSFWKLKQVDGKWVASLYSWTRINGRGWADPGQYYQGARAVGIPASAGLIRIHEAAARPEFYPHALAMSLAFTGLSANPSYVFPATSGDTHAARMNSGTIPEGSLLMLPPDFDTSKISNEEVRRIAETLKRFGAYVVDCNAITPFLIYAEISSAANPLNFGTYEDATRELQLIRAGLRRVIGSSSWVDGNGKTFVPNKNLNLFSMRGVWAQHSGNVIAKYSSWDQAVVFPATQSVSEVVNYSNRGMQHVNWAKPQMGSLYKLTARTTGGGKLRVTIYDQLTGKVVTDTGYLGNNESKTFTWNANSPRLTVYAQSGVGNSSHIGGELLRAE